MLLGNDDVDYVVPVLDGTALRAALVITKSGAGLSANHKILVRDIARGATLLLRGEARNAELSELVRRAEHRVGGLRASLGRLIEEREIERRWLADELAHAMGGRTFALRQVVAAAHECLTRQPSEQEAARAALAQVGLTLDTMANGVRATVRRIYPRTLEGSGLTAALEELLVDLRRPVQWSGDLGGRLDWEIECGVFCAAATALRILSAQPSEQELLVAGDRADRQVAVRIVDPGPTVALHALQAGMAVEVERLAALGGGLTITGPGADEGGRAGRFTLEAWLPDRLEPAVAGHLDVDARQR